MMDRTLFLETLPSGEKLGKLPSSVGMANLRLLGHPETPIAAIRAHCIECSGGSRAEVRRCNLLKCPLWPMRMGRNPFYGQGSAGGASEEPCI
jgi:hypothetical protein